jgi:molecular chaperone DnaJ
MGEGHKITHPCTTCHGTGVENLEVSEEVSFPRGIENEAVLRFKGKGHMGGDLEVSVLVKAHPSIMRKGIDAVSSLSIDDVDAVLGCEAEVTTIYGEVKKLKIPPGTQFGDEIVLQRCGFYRVNTSTKGNHVVVVKIKIPTSLSSEQRSVYETLKKMSQETAKKAL